VEYRMLDSGTVLDFNGMRKGTDVDVLFLGNVDKIILGKFNGVQYQATSHIKSFYIKIPAISNYLSYQIILYKNPTNIKLPFISNHSVFNNGFSY
jgi:hypothetical protein